MTTPAFGSPSGSGPSTGPALDRQRLVDLGLAALYTVVFLGYTVVQYGPKVRHLPLTAGGGPAGLAIVTKVELVSLAAVLFVVICAVALVFRRSSPHASFMVICAVGSVQVAIGEPISLWDVAMPIALFSAAAYADRGFGRVVLGIAILAYVGIWALEVDLLHRLDALLNPAAVLTSARGAAFVVMFAVLVVIWAVGDQVRAGRERHERELERAVGLEREREANARIGALAERQRIARELHDVVAHGLAVMIVQADGALYAEAEHPEAPRQALTTIAATGRESLGEMRRLLGVLRDDPDAANLAPQSELAALPQLIERAREAGLDVAYEAEGAQRPVPHAVGLAAYRVVQESLTNVINHAGPTRVEVRLSFLPDALRIVVRNEAGAIPPAPRDGATPGLGLIGMRERVALLGGRMAAAPTPEGGFKVDVEIPVPWPDADPRELGEPRWTPAPLADGPEPGRAGGRP